MKFPIIASNASASSIESYIQYTSSVPLLSKEEEFALAQDLQDNNNLEAAQKLVLSHLRYVVRVAKGYLGYGLNLGDLIQEGTVGLMKAVKKFTPEKDVRLVTFAMHWIKSEINEFVIRNWRVVKIATTKAQRKLFFKLRSKKKTLEWLSVAEREVIAQDLGVKAKEVEQMEARLYTADVAFDLPEQENDETFAPVEYLEDKSVYASPLATVESGDWDNMAQDKFSEVFAKLDGRSQRILTCRWLQGEGMKATLADLAEEMQISKERVRQLERKAIQQMRELIEEAV